jgi:predicted transcriptional regulator
MKGIRLSGPQSVVADQENPRLISDLMYRIYVREAIEAGIKDSDQGRTVDVKEVRRGFRIIKS